MIRYAEAANAAVRREQRLSLNRDLTGGANREWRTGTRRGSAVIIDDAFQHLLKIDRRLVAYESLHFAKIWQTPRHIFEAGFISLVVRNETDYRG